MSIWPQAMVVEINDLNSLDMESLDLPVNFWESPLFWAAAGLLAIPSIAMFDYVSEGPLSSMFSSMFIPTEVPNLAPERDPALGDVISAARFNEGPINENFSLTNQVRWDAPDGSNLSFKVYTDRPLDQFNFSYETKPPTNSVIFRQYLLKHITKLSESISKMYSQDELELIKNKTFPGNDIVLHGDLNHEGQTWDINGGLIRFPRNNSNFESHDRLPEVPNYEVATRCIKTNGPNPVCLDRSYFLKSRPFIDLNALLLHARWYGFWIYVLLEKQDPAYNAHIINTFCLDPERRLVDLLYFYHTFPDFFDSLLDGVSLEYSPKITQYFGQDGPDSKIIYTVPGHMPLRHPFLFLYAMITRSDIDPNDLDIDWSKLEPEQLPPWRVYRRLSTYNDFVATPFIATEAFEEFFPHLRNLLDDYAPVRGYEGNDSRFLNGLMDSPLICRNMFNNNASWELTHDARSDYLDSLFRYYFLFNNKRYLVFSWSGEGLFVEKTAFYDILIYLDHYKGIDLSLFPLDLLTSFSWMHDPHYFDLRALLASYPKTLEYFLAVKAHLFVHKGPVHTAHNYYWQKPTYQYPKGVFVDLFLEFAANFDTFFGNELRCFKEPLELFVSSNDYNPVTEVHLDVHYPVRPLPLADYPALYEHKRWVDGERLGCPRHILYKELSLAYIGQPNIPPVDPSKSEWIEWLNQRGTRFDYSHLVPMTPMEKLKTWMFGSDKIIDFTPKDEEMSFDLQRPFFKYSRYLTRWGTFENYYRFVKDPWFFNGRVYFVSQNDYYHYKRSEFMFNGLVDYPKWFRFPLQWNFWRYPYPSGYCRFLPLTAPPGLSVKDIWTIHPDTGGIPPHVHEPFFDGTPIIHLPNRDNNCAINFNWYTYKHPDIQGPISGRPHILPLRPIPKDEYFQLLNKVTKELKESPKEPFSFTSNVLAPVHHDPLGYHFRVHQVDVDKCFDFYSEFMKISDVESRSSLI